MEPLFIKKDGLNLVDLAVRDLTVAAAILRKPRSGVVGLDCRELAGGAAALAVGPNCFSGYCRALDAAVSRVPGLRTANYAIRRSHA